MPHRMRELRAIAIDDSVAWASLGLSVSLSVDCSYSFSIWRHFDAAITMLL